MLVVFDSHYSKQYCAICVIGCSSSGSSVGYVAAPSFTKSLMKCTLCLNDAPTNYSTSHDWKGITKNHQAYCAYSRMNFKKLLQSQHQDVHEEEIEWQSGSVAIIASFGFSQCQFIGQTT